MLLCNNLLSLCTMLIFNLLLIFAIWRCKTVFLRKQNSPFHELKGTVLHTEMICFGLVAFLLQQGTELVYIPNIRTTIVSNIL